MSLRLLHIDTSARAGRSGTDPHGSHSRRLSARFVERWHALRPGDAVEHLDVGQQPPGFVDGRWIHAAFTAPEQRGPWMTERLAESDRLVDQLLAADLVVVGLPMYNFGVPAQFKAWIDNVVRVGLTFGFDRSRAGEPYWPMLAPGKRLIILTARGDYGYDADGRLASMNLVEAGLKTPLAYIGMHDSDTVAIEYDEFADERLARSIAAAETAVDRLVDRLASTMAGG
jgi:FMN-dependent NADH-azoreductase